MLVSSFTRAAARELVMRDLPINDDRIGTLHALGFRALNRPKLANSAPLYKEWNSQYPQWTFGGYTDNLDDPYGDSEGDGAGEGDRFLQALNRFRGLRMPIDQMPYTVQHFAEAWQDFKDNTGTVDFTDLIEHCLNERVPIPHESAVMFLDEVQDFSPLELALARWWGESCEKLYLAGDDDQCLYRFKGATPDAFLYPELPADQIRILGQSYRIPRAVHAQACGWVEQIAHRMPKTYHPRAIDGTVDHLASLSYRYMDPIGSQLEQWLEEGKTVAFLGSCSYLLDPMKKLLRDWGVPFHNPYRKTRGDWNPLQSKAGTISAAERVLAYQQVAHGSWWTYADLWKWAAALNATQSLFIHGAKTEMRRKADDEGSQPVSVEDLERWMPGDTVAPHAVAGDLTWLQGAPLLDSFVRPMTYACNVVQRRGREALAKKPQVILGTIHSVKGGEADIVVLFPDLSPAGMEEWCTPGETQDSVRRVFYVGMTRAKEALYWTSPAGGMCIDGY